LVQPAASCSGQLLLIAVQDLIEQFKLQPTAHAIAAGDVRRALVPKYPYSVLYRVRRKQIVIIAIVHSSRDPSVWQSRV
jgi:plasmid stabilization system protein ParE